MNEMTDEIKVENCNGDNSTDSPPRRRRRSSFFERRSIGSVETKPSVPETSMDVDTDGTKDQEFDEHLNKYYTALLSEKSQWKKEVQNRRGILHDTELQLKLAKKSDKIRINYSILSNEDIDFVRSKPNLTDLVDSVKKLQQSTVQTYTMYKRVKELDDFILADAEMKVDRVARLLLENSGVGVK